MRADPAPTPGPALGAFVAGALAAASHSLSARGGRIHDGIHQARKSIRRARAALSLTRDALGPGARWLDDELRRLNDRLSPLRDAHALVETLARLRRKPRRGLDPGALASACRSAMRRRAQLARSPGFAAEVAGVRAILDMLQATLCALDWSRVDEATVDAALREATARAQAAGKRALADDRTEDWHRWRRRLRRTSQQCRAATAAGMERRPDAFESSAAEQLGRLQDLSLLVEHCRKPSGFDESTRADLKAHGKRLLARQRGRIRSVVQDGSTAAGK
jgi:hypothetical protein